MAFADKPNHFINFPLTQFSGFMGKYLKLQSQLVEMGLDCKLQKAPHVSITLLDIKADQYKQVEFAIQEIIDDLAAYEGDIVFDNPHMLGRCLVLDVRGFEELHEDIVEILRRRGCTADQSRHRIPHCTVAQFDEERETKGMQFYHKEPFYLKHNNLLTDAGLELVKIGSSKIFQAVIVWFVI
uniref:Phosphodiesterase n=1 Tax=Murine hepatitis virus TaxID=11138 RepID=A0A2D1CED1_9BETC|nr:phosphodiesterase [Murine hepatitis virus]